MSTFWRPIGAMSHLEVRPPMRQVRHGRVCVLWCRCDLCRWSGPAGRFVTLRRGSDVTDICLHDWCYGDPAIARQLREEGWTDELPF
jgi:hypothetical protein